LGWQEGLGRDLRPGEGTEREPGEGLRLGREKRRRTAARSHGEPLPGSAQEGGVDAAGGSIPKGSSLP
jgi:hypothetical protein